MDNGKTIITTFQKLESERQPLEKAWKDAFKYTFPLRGQSFLSKNNDPVATANNAFKEQAEIFDTTAADSARLLAATLLSGLTPPNSQWFDLALPDLQESEIPYEAREWLQQAAKKLWLMIHSSNYDTEAFEFMLDEVVGGMNGLYIEESKDGGFIFEHWPLDGLYVAETLNRKIIDTVYREVPYTIAQAVKKFGLKNLPQHMQEAYKNNPDDNKLHSFIHTIRPRIRNGKQTKGKFKKTLPFESIYVCRKTGMIVKEGGYHEFPLAIPRWLAIPNTTYAVGAVDAALPDIKTVNKVVQMVLTNAEMAIAGTFIAKEDGVINPSTIRIGPRRIIFAADPNNIRPLTTGGNFNIAAVEIERLQKQIRKILMANDLLPENYGSSVAATATEIRTRMNIIRQLLGPSYARFQAEYLTPLIERCFGIAYRNGWLGEAPEFIQDLDIMPVYQSPLARAQKLEDVQSMEQYEQSIINAAQVDQTVLDVYDFDAAARYKSELLGVPLKVIRTPAEVEKLRKQRAEQQQQILEMQQQAQQQG